jgi:hypothetical protein
VSYSSMLLQDAVAKSLWGRFDEASFQRAEVRRIRVLFLSASTAGVLLPTASLASNDLQALSP